MACVVSCSEEDNDAAPKLALKTALDALNEGNYDLYLQYSDYGSDEDSLHVELLKELLRQHQDWQTKNLGKLATIKVTDVKMKNDSVCVAYYQYVFEDSTKTQSSQKMVRSGNLWKLVLKD